MEKWQSQFRTNECGIISCRWMGTKEVLVLNNCHEKTTTVVKRCQKDGTVLQVPCPDAISFYNSIMEGVDMGDQSSIAYELVVEESYLSFVHDNSSKFVDFTPETQEEEVDVVRISSATS